MSNHSLRTHTIFYAQYLGRLDMAKDLPDVPFRIFLYATLVAHIVHAVPTVVVLLFFDSTTAMPLLFILLILAVIKIPVVAAMTWLLAKGSNWVNSSLAMIVICRVAAMLYCVLIGAWLGFRLFGTAGGVIGAILLYLLARITSRRLGKLLTQKLLLVSDPA